MLRVRLGQAVRDRPGKGGEVGVILGVQYLLFHEFPKPFDQVQIGRVRRQVEQFDFEGLRQSPHDFALLIASVVQYQRDGNSRMGRSNLP